MKFILIIFNIIFVFQFGSSQIILNFYKIECGNETKYVKDIQCQLKPVSRGVKSLTIYSEQIRPLKDVINANLEVVHNKPRNNFQSVILNITVEFCSSFSNMPPIVKLILSLIEKSASNLIHECPYLPSKEVGIQNFIVNSNLLQVVVFLGIQSGEFLATITITDKKGDLVFKVKIFCVLEKEKFKKKTKINKN
ncbi:hypothetical protein ACKWTF_013634 [Chironomus riparius]